MPHSLNNVALIWGESQSSGDLTVSPQVSVAAWSQVLCKPWLRWREGEMPDLSQYGLIMINLFPTSDSAHIEQIKCRYPDKTVIAMPDPPLDEVLNNPDWLPMWRQMALADVIGGRTPYDCQVYGRLLNKPAVWLPSPAGPTDYFLPYRKLPKEPYIVTQDHPWTSTKATAQNVAALATIQRKYPQYRVVYAAAQDHTKEYAVLAGLNVEFCDQMPWLEFVALTARAKYSVDIYAQHSYHRHAVMCALVGTPCITGTWSGDVGHPKVDPFYPDEALRVIERMTENEYRAAQVSGYVEVERRYGFDVSRRRIEMLLEKVKVAA